MSWVLLSEDDVEIADVISFRMEQSKGKPATLSWETPSKNATRFRNVTLFRGVECVFKGRVYEHPTHFHEGLSTWTAIAIDDTFHTQRSTLISKLNQDMKLSANLKDCEGALAGHLNIDRVTHSVCWTPLSHPQEIWDTHELHERDSIYITPLDQPLKGFSASANLTSKRLESGMMDVGANISSRLPHGVETYSGTALEDQWAKLAFKALRAGYDIQQAELLPTSYQRANAPKSLTFFDHKNQLTSIPYQAYAVKLLLSWAVPVTTHTTVTVCTENAQESIALTVKDMESANESDVVNELIHWMNAYALIRSFTTQVKFRILLTDDISVSQLDIKNWCRVRDHRIQSRPIEGPIVSYTLWNEGGITWADVTFMWAPEGSLHIGSTVQLMTSSGEPVQLPQAPDQIVAWVKVLHDADDQYQYYQRYQTEPFDQFLAEFPMTQLEIGFYPVLNQSIEFIEKYYHAIHKT